MNRAALLGTLVFVIIDAINRQETWIIKYAKYNRTHIVEFFVIMLDLNLENLAMSPLSLRHSIVNVSNMMKLLNVWLT